ncbi:4-hydroxybenzoate polyprenyltransferase, mitochondrial [Glycine max]|nr:4-hydroxybenzoate polyprenyltransferase, mitochondrial [Glycine max]
MWGALLLRGARCTINDLFDRDIDTMVERTKLRQVASGLLTPFQGLCFLGFQLLLGLGILLQLNSYSRVLGASSLLLFFSYPFMKRFTFWWITGFEIACLGGLAVSGFNAEIGWLYYASLAVVSGHLGWQTWAVDLSSRTDCNRKFVSNKWFRAIIFGGILAGGLSSLWC